MQVRRNTDRGNGELIKSLKKLHMVRTGIHAASYLMPAAVGPLGCDGALKICIACTTFCFQLTMILSNLIKLHVNLPPPYEISPSKQALTMRPFRIFEATVQLSWAGGNGRLGKVARHWLPVSRACQTIRQTM